MIIKFKTENIIPKNLGEYYKFSIEYKLRKKMTDIFKKNDRKDLEFYFKRWKNKRNLKKKKFLLYFIMLIKEYFCNDKSVKLNKEYEIGKSMFFWYRKTFH